MVQKSLRICLFYATGLFACCLLIELSQRDYLVPDLVEETVADGNLFLNTTTFANKAAVNKVNGQDEFDASRNCTLFAPKLFPELNPGQDRIFEQLTYTTCVNGTAEEKSKPLTILLWDGGAGWSENSLQSGQETEGCKVANCELSFDKSELQRPDLVLFQGTTFKAPSFEKPDGQVWLWYNLESPSNTFLKNMSMLDWTATYRRDSTIVTPYAKWRAFENVQGVNNPNKK